jgi:serine/threonine protein kinase
MNASDLPDETLFEGALKCRPPAERAAYLDQACAGQPELRRRLEELLAAHDRSGEFLEPTEAAAARPTIALDLVPEETPGTMIGRYKLLQKIGEGGMGVVYMAEQTEPVIRKVAFKIIKLGMDTHQVVARFEAERQALALMDHPNIAKVLDAGATDTGRPYFVMELIHGVPITEYCDKNKLSTQQRLELFIPVCQAIQHAHQKGIIHRDIKPSNVMVTLHDGVPVPKVIDFGVAKATNQRLTEKTLFTHYAQMIGTPAYMSPEQAEMSGLDIDTRSDIYSLGVLLYELLTGTTPFDAKELLSKGYAEMQRIIAEQEPPKPSTRMSTLEDEQRTVVATQRSTEASALRKVLQGDLDWIVMKCLEKDRTRRYETSNGLAADLRRHLSNELITARPPTTGYLIKKLIKRNRLAFATGTAIAALLVVGIAVSTWQALRATRAEYRALATVAELRETAPAFAEQARTLVAQSKFDEAITKLDYAVKLRPDVADYLVVKAGLLQCQLKLAEAAQIYRAALEVQSDHKRASANLELCEGLISAQAAGGGNLSTESLAKLLKAMEAEQRSAAELLPVSQKLGREKEILLGYWLEQLKDLPIPADKPLKDRLSLAESGRLALDLSSTSLSDLSPISGMPIDSLSLTNCRQVIDLTPLHGLLLRTLLLNNTSVRDLSSMRHQTNLVRLYARGTPIADLTPLQGLKLQYLDLADCNHLTDIQPLAGMPLIELRLRSTRVTSLAPLRGMPLKMLDLTSVPALDFESLSGLPLEKLYLQSVGVGNLSFLKGMPLKHLTLWNANEARGFSVLSGLETLELLMLPQNVYELPEPELRALESLQKHPTLRQIAADVQGGIIDLFTATAPKEVFWLNWTAERAFAQRRYAQAAPLLSNIAEVLRRAKPVNDPTMLDVTKKLAKCQAALGNYAEAARLLRIVVDARIAQNGPNGSDEESFDWIHLAITLVAAGDHDGYQRVCRELMPRFTDDQDKYYGFFCERILKLCSLTAHAGVSEAVIDRLARDVNNPMREWQSIALAMRAFRAGQWTKAEDLLQKLETPYEPINRIYANLLLAMVRHYQGRYPEASVLLVRARDALDGNWPPSGNTVAPLWYDWLYLRVLLNEATALIEGKFDGNTGAKRAASPTKNGAERTSQP